MRTQLSVCSHTSDLTHITEDVDHDPAKAARDARKEKMAKNERQHQQNLARAQGASASATAPAPPQERKKQIDRTLATTRSSTASMGKFDRKLEGEKKLKGVKRKVRRCVSAMSKASKLIFCLQFDPTEVSASNEKSHNLAIFQGLDRGPTAKKSRSSGDDVLNVRKAIRSASKGKGSAALSREGGGAKSRSNKGRR